MALAPLVRSSSPALVHDGQSFNSAARFALERLIQTRPQVERDVIGRGCVMVAFEGRADDFQMRELLAVMSARFSLSSLETPLFVAGLGASEAIPLRGLRMRSPRGHFIGTCGAGEGGVIFVSNIDDTVIGSENWDAAEEFVTRALDELMGPLV